MNTCPNCGKIAGLHSSILQGCMCQYSMQAPPQRTEQEPVKYSDYEPDGVHHNKPAQPEQKLIGTVGDLFDDRVIAHRKLDRDLLVYIKEKNTHEAI